MDNPNAATPAEQPNGGTPPPAPAATPAPKAPEAVTLTKEEHNQLLRDQARAQANQRKADLFDRMNGGKGNGRHFSPQAPVTPPTQEELAATGAQEDEKAKKGLLQIALDPAYRDILDKDSTLRELISKDPLAVLTLLAPDALDAEDAVTLVKEALDKRKPTPAAAPTPADPNPTPPAGGVNVDDQPVNQEYETARNNPNTEDAISGMVAAKIKARAGKK